MRTFEKTSSHWHCENSDCLWAVRTSENAGCQESSFRSLDTLNKGCVQWMCQLTSTGHACDGSISRSATHVYIPIRSSQSASTSEYLIGWRCLLPSQELVLFSFYLNRPTRLSFMVATAFVLGTTTVAEGDVESYEPDSKPCWLRLLLSRLDLVILLYHFE